MTPSASKPSEPRGKRIKDWWVNAVLVTLIRTALLMPYEIRVRWLGGAVARLIGPLAGYRTQARQNIRMIWPDLHTDEVNRIAAGCLHNAGRTFIENYSANDFPQRMAHNPLTGPGWPALEKANADGQPVILVTGHYGNYEAVRAALAGRGLKVGGLYRNMSNSYFNAHYVKTMEAFGGPVFAQGRIGTAGFVRHLKDGGQLVLLFDQHVIGAPLLDFMGHPAHTALSAAELALRYNALLIPFYGIRQPDGLSFETTLEAPIAHSDPKTMTQALNDSLSQRIKDDPTQWFWVHRRWRPTANSTASQP